MNITSNQIHDWRQGRRVPDGMSVTDFVDALCSMALETPAKRELYFEVATDELGRLMWVEPYLFNHPRLGLHPLVRRGQRAYTVVSSVLVDNGVIRTVIRGVNEPAQPAVPPNPWREAVIDCLVVNHIYTAEHDSKPDKAVGDLLAYGARCRGIFCAAYEPIEDEL
jgi:hypothetical protein